MWLTRRVDEPLTAAYCSEASSWIACRRQTYERVAVLTGAAEAMDRSVGSSRSLFHDLTVYHDECQALTREALGPNRYHEAQKYGAFAGVRSRSRLRPRGAVRWPQRGCRSHRRPELSGQLRVTISRRASLECPVVDIESPSMPAPVRLFPAPAPASGVSRARRTSVPH